VPCGAVLDSADILVDRHLRERNSIRTMHHPVRGDWQLAGTPVRLSASPIEYQSSPLLGEHSEEVLGQMLNLSADDVRALREGGVI
jgi:formyl-CoA transferase